MAREHRLFAPLDDGDSPLGAWCPRSQGYYPREEVECKTTEVRCLTGFE